MKTTITNTQLAIIYVVITICLLLYSYFTGKGSAAQFLFN